MLNKLLKFLLGIERGGPKRTSSRYVGDRKPTATDVVVVKFTVGVFVDLSPSETFQKRAQKALKESIKKVLAKVDNTMFVVNSDYSVTIIEPEDMGGDDKKETVQ